VIAGNIGAESLITNIFFVARTAVNFYCSISENTACYLSWPRSSDGLFTYTK